MSEPDPRAAAPGAAASGSPTAAPGPEAQPTGGSLGHRTIQAMGWAYGSYVGGRALVLAATAILARLLTPSDFGVVAVALVFMTFLETLKDLGLTQALIAASPQDEKARAQTVFVWTVVIAASLALLASAAAQPAATFFKHSSLRAIIPVLSGAFVIEALGATHDALARKRLNYRARAFADGADVLTRGAAGIALALLGFGAWSLVLGYLIGTTARTALLWGLIPFRPKLRLSREHLRSLVRFGGVLTLVDVMAAIVQNIDYLFVGRVLGSTALGLYMMGYRLPELLIMNVAIVAGGVLFPAYSELGRERMQDGFLVSLRFTTALVLPIGFALVLLAKPFVLALFGPHWHRSIPVLRVLAAYAVLTTINIPAGTIYKVTGRAWILLTIGVPYLIGLFAALVVFGSKGILAVAICMAASQALTALAYLIVAQRILRVSYGRMARSVAGPLVASLGMACALIPVVGLIEAPWPALLVGGLVAALAYAFLARLLVRDLVRRLLDAFLRPLLGRRRERKPGLERP